MKKPLKPVRINLMLNDIVPPSKPPRETGGEPSGVEPPVESLDEPIVIDEASEELTEQKAPAAKSGRFAWVGQLKSRWHRLSRRQRILAGAGGLVILVALIFGGIAIFSHPAPMIPRVASHKTATTVASPLTGLQVNPALAKRPVTAIMIENSLDARPQSGLQDAGVVYEAIAEGGVTRFMALFQESRPQYIGPVRSLRPYFIDWATPFDASIAHVGGSPDALSQIRSGGKDLDEFFNAGSYWRISTRAAPHNVYTSFDKLDDLNQSKGYITSKVHSFPRKKAKPLKVPTATSIDFAISGPVYNPHYGYDVKTNSYTRSEGGAPHMDLVSAADTTGVQLKPKVVIAIVVPLTSGALDASGAYYSNYSANSSGAAYIFQDGGVTVGTWTKASRTHQISFVDAKGAPIKLDPGQTWITALSTAGQISYK